jgi:hypothetical protein
VAIARLGFGEQIPGLSFRNEFNLYPLSLNLISTHEVANKIQNQNARNTKFDT